MMRARYVQTRFFSVSRFRSRSAVKTRRRPLTCELIEVSRNEIPLCSPLSDLHMLDYELPALASVARIANVIAGARAIPGRIINKRLILVGKALGML